MFGEAGGGGGDVEEPPAFFRAESDPVADGIGNTVREGVFDGPSEDEEFLAEEAFDLVDTDGPAAGTEFFCAEAFVEFAFDVFGDEGPDGAGEEAAFGDIGKATDVGANAVAFDDGDGGGAAGWDVDFEAMGIGSFGTAEAPPWW